MVKLVRLTDLDGSLNSGREQDCQLGHGIDATVEVEDLEERYS